MLLERWRKRLAERRGELGARRVLVLCGGGSQEREVSLRSGRAVFNALAARNYAAVLSTVSPDNVSLDAIESTSATKPTLEGSQGQAESSALVGSGGQGLLRALQEGPVMALSTMHGNLGENGAWQGLLELLDVPFVSAGVKGSALGMDKLISKRLFEQLGVPTPRWWLLRDGAAGVTQCRENVDVAIAGLVAKPVSEGSSVGVELVTNDDAGWERIALLGERFDPLLIEERINGAEITVAVIGPSRDCLALPLVQIKPRQEFYSYDAKYTAGGSEYICPAPLDAHTARRISVFAETIYREFDLGPYARIDCLLDAEGKPWFLEANTLPGFTDLSLVPMAARAAGIEMGELLELLMLFALERWEQGHARSAAQTDKEAAQ